MRETPLLTQENESVTLNEEEIAILQLLTTGEDTNDIEETIKPVNGSVKKTLSVLWKKLGVQSNVGAVIVGIQQKIINTEELNKDSRLERVSGLTRIQNDVVNATIECKGYTSEIERKLGTHHLNGYLDTITHRLGAATHEQAIALCMAWKLKTK